jgi:ribosomal protein S18
MGGDAGAAKRARHDHPDDHPDSHRDVWWEKYNLLKVYITKNKRLPTCKETDGDFNIGGWIGTQRRIKKGQGQGRITAEQIQALEALPGWHWGQDLDAAWYAKFTQLKAFVAEHGRIPTKAETTRDFRVGRWVHAQRRAKRRGRLSAEQTQALEGLPDWYWERGPDASWYTNFAILKAYVTRHGRLPTQSNSIQEFNAKSWINNQRQARKGQGKGRLTAGQVQALEALPDWRWCRDPDTLWREKFDILEAYVARHRRLPARDETVGTFRIGDWAHNQRQAMKKQSKRRLTAEQSQALERLLDRL